MSRTNYQQTTLSVITSLVLLGVASPSWASAQQPQTPLILAQQTGNRKLNQLLYQGRKYADAGDYARAIASYQQAASLDRQNAKIYSGIGYLEAKQGNFTAAAQAYQQAVALDPDNAEFYYALGYSLANTGNNIGAASAYYRAAQLDPPKC